MNFQNSTGKTIQQAFEKFHADNPLVYEHFIRLALKAIYAGKKKISFKMILNVIRWEVFLETKEETLFEHKGTKHMFKINDAYSSRYARLFVDNYPQHIDKVEMREIRSQ